MLHLLNKYKSSDEISRKKIKSSIKKLILENSEDYNKFISSNSLDLNSLDFLKSCSLENLENANLSVNSKINLEEDSDFNNIKKAFITWNNEYKKNNLQPNKICDKIILDIVNFYALNRFEVLKKILELEDSQDYENFKNMLKNYLRKYFAEKIGEYFQSSNFSSLGFFKRRTKKNLILKVLDEIGDYHFDIKRIKEVI